MADQFFRIVSMGPMRRGAIQMMMRILLLLAAVLASSYSSALATVWHVPADFSTLQEAINDAASGDEIILADGIYTGPGFEYLVIAGKSLLIRSENGPDRTILDAERETRRAFDVDVSEGETVEIRGIGIRQFRQYSGAGMRVRGGGVCRIVDCAFVSCTGGTDDVGAALWILDTVDCWISDCEFRENLAYLGAAIWAESEGNITVDGCLFLSNGNKAVIQNGSGLMSVWNSTWAGNGGALTAFAGEVEIARSLVMHGDDSGPAIRTRVPTRISECTIFGNRSYHSEYAGGVQVEGGELTLTSTIIRGNCRPFAYPDLAVTGGTAIVTCCALDPAGVQGWERITLVGEQVWTDPLFCDPLPCRVYEEEDYNGRYSLDESSPCLGSATPCGETIGALGAGCGTEHVGACCVSAECVILGAEDCQQQGGAYMGDGTVCDPGTCVPDPTIKTSWGALKARYR